MSTGKSQNLKGSKPKRRRVGPAKTAAEAYGRWALGHAGRAQRGEIDAYTAEHYVQDQAAGVIIRPVDRGCPRARPDRACRAEAEVPVYYRTPWRRRSIDRPRRTAPAEAATVSSLDPAPAPERATIRRASGSRSPGRELARADAEVAALPAPLVVVAVAVVAAPLPGRPRRRTAVMRPICFDCRLWLEWGDRRRFAEEYGEDDRTRGYRTAPRVADAQETMRAAHEKARQSYAEIEAVAGAIAEPLDWFEVNRLAAAVRVCLRRYVEACAG